MTFVRDALTLTNARKHKTTLRVPTGNTKHSTYEEKIRVRGGPQPIFIPALAVPDFVDNLISVGKLVEKNNVDFTKDVVY